MQRSSLPPYGTPFSVDSPAVSSPAASSVGPSSASHAALGYLGDPGPGEVAGGTDGEGHGALKQEAGLTASSAVGDATVMQQVVRGGEEGGASGSGRQSGMKGRHSGLLDSLR